MTTPPLHAHSRSPAARVCSLLARACVSVQDAGPMAHPIRPESYIAMDNFYTVTVYNKGAEVIRMHRTCAAPQLSHPASLRSSSLCR